MAGAGPAISAIASAVKTFFTAKGIGYAIARFVVFTAVSVAISRRQDAFDPGLTAREVSVKGTIEPQRIIYGEAMTSGPIIYTNTAGNANQRLWVVIALAGHEVESITDIQFDQDTIANADINGGDPAGGDVTGGKYAVPALLVSATTIGKFLGTSTQTNYTTLTNDIPGQWTVEHRLRGIAYIAVRMVLEESTEDLWNSAQPQNIRALVRGKKIYDPRLDTSPGANPTNPAYIAWSDNPALCVADYAIDTRFGVGIDPARMDWDAVVTAADHCDELVVVPSGSEKRFTCNGVLFASASHKENIEKMLTSMNGSFIKSGGKWVVYAGQYIAPDPADSFDESHLAGTLTISTAIGRSERINTARGIFVDPEQRYKTSETKPIQLADLLARDGGYEISADFELPFTNSHYMAQRIIRKKLLLMSREISVVAPMNFHAARMPVGERITFSCDELGWVDKTAIVEHWKLTDNGSQPGVELTFRLEDASHYADPVVFDYDVRVVPTAYVVPGYVNPDNPGVITSTVHYGDATIDYKLYAKQNAAGATEAGAIRVTAGDLVFEGQRRNIPVDVALNTTLNKPWVFQWAETYVIHGVEPIATRFPTLTGQYSAAPYGMFIAGYNRQTLQWYAMSGDGLIAVEFTPIIQSDNRDIVVAALRKFTGVHEIGQLSVVVDQVADVDATEGAQAGQNLTDSNGNTLTDADIRNDQQSIADLGLDNDNPNFTQSRIEGDLAGAHALAPKGWFSANVTALADMPQYLDDDVREVMVLKSGTAATNTAFRITPGTQYELVALVRAQSGTANVQLRIEEYDGDTLPEGKLAISAVGSIGQTRTRLISVTNDPAVGTTYKLVRATYTPTATAKWGSMLFWPQNTVAIEARYAGVRSLATVGGQLGTGGNITDSNGDPIDDDDVLNSSLKTINAPQQVQWVSYGTTSAAYSPTQATQTATVTVTNGAGNVIATRTVSGTVTYSSGIVNVTAGTVDGITVAVSNNNTTYVSVTLSYSGAPDRGMVFWTLASTGGGVGGK